MRRKLIRELREEIALLRSVIKILITILEKVLSSEHDFLFERTYNFKNLKVTTDHMANYLLPATTAQVTGTVKGITQGGNKVPAPANGLTITASGTGQAAITQNGADFTVDFTNQSENVFVDITYNGTNDQGQAVSGFDRFNWQPAQQDPIVSLEGEFVGLTPL